MNKYISVLAALFFALSVAQAQPQSKFSKLSVFGGIALGREDRRLFTLPNPEEYLDNKERLDKTYTLGLLIEAFAYKRFEITTGMGYMAQNTQFGRPFNVAYFTGAQPLVYIKRYTISQITLPVTTTLYLDKSKQIGIMGSYVNNIGFRRLFNGKYSEWKFFYKSFEFYPGLVVRLNKHISLDACYRRFYRNKFDIITTGLAMGWGYENIKFERYNPRTVMFRMRYHL